MEETVKDFLEQQEERNLLARTGRTRPLSKPGIPTRREWEAQNGPVITKKLPTLPSTAARLRWLKARDDLTNKELAQKAGVSAATLYRVFAGSRVQESTLQEIADAFDVSLDWIKGSTQTLAEPVQTAAGQTSHPKQQNSFKTCCNTLFRFEMELRGKHSGRRLKELLCGLPDDMEYAVSLEIKAEAPK